MDRAIKAVLLIAIVAIAACIPGRGQSVGSSQNEPAAKDPLSQKVSLELSNQTVFDGVAKLSQSTNSLGFAVERELTKKKWPKLPPVVRFTATIADVSIRDALNWLCKLDPRYAWTI